MAVSEGTRAVRWVHHLAFAGVVGLLVLLVAFAFHSDLSSPLVGMTDIGHYGHAADYFARNLRLFPFPHLDLVRDENLYPYGGVQVFQHWLLELHYLFAVLRAGVGPGPWFQLYFLFTLAVTALGVYALLVGLHGPLRAAGVALVVAFGNFFVLERYPDHFPYAYLHWTILGIVTDYRIAERFERGEPWSLRLFLLRVFFLIAGLGQDIANMAGIGMTSFCLTAGYLLAVTALRRLRAGTPRPATLAPLAAQARSHPWQCAALGVASALLAFLYVPLCLQIVSTALSFDFTGYSQGHWWAHRLRLFLPVLPGFDLGLDAYQDLFGDDITRRFDFRPGLGLLLLAVLGLATGGLARVRPLIPFLLLMAMILDFRLDGHSPIQLFPWFRFSRMAARLAVVFPLLYCLFALNLPRLRQQGRVLRALTLVCLLLVGAETWHAYARVAPRVGAERQDLVVVPDADFLHLMETIRRAPGEALFEWPFVVIGANGVGMLELGAFYPELSSTIQFKQFHGKKIVGGYYNRLHRSQIQPLVEAGWPQLLQSDPADVWGPARKQFQLRPEHWDFLMEFLQLNDFAGVLLYPDLINPANAEGFYRRMGPPIAEARFPGQGRLQFIPRPAAWRDRVDRERGRKLRLRDLQVGPAD